MLRSILTLKVVRVVIILSSHPQVLHRIVMWDILSIKGVVMLIILSLRPRVVRWMVMWGIFCVKGVRMLGTGAMSTSSQVACILVTRYGLGVEGVRKLIV
jgi:hypothetical protein